MLPNDQQTQNNNQHNDSVSTEGGLSQYMIEQQNAFKQQNSPVVEQPLMPSGLASNQNQAQAQSFDILARNTGSNIDLNHQDNSEPPKWRGSDGSIDYALCIEDLIATAAAVGASDLHISADSYPILRVNEKLTPLINRGVITAFDSKEILKLLMPEAMRNAFEEKKSVDFSYAFKDVVRLRGNGFYEKGNVSIALRLIPGVVRDLKDLNLPEVLATFCYKKQGFFLVVGPVGEGKSTTLAAMLEVINQTRSEHIITIEDPIEYLYEPKQCLIDQRAVGIDTPDFRTALTDALREDVNVILVGEMRDRDTIAAAVTAAETGHLVFATLHTNSASQTLDRIIDSFPADQQSQVRFQLANSLLGIFSQRLIPKVGGGLIVAAELLINNSAVANLIRDNRTYEIDSVIETGLEEGMIDMNRSLAALVQTGQITIESAYTHATNQRSLEQLMS